MRPGDSVAAAVTAVHQWLGPMRPVAAIVLGSGLGGLTAHLVSPTRLSYDRIPGFPRPGVAGHAGELVAGELEGRIVLCQSGRCHVYEGHSPATVVLPARVFARLGIRAVLLTNAAGGIRRTLRPGSLMLIADQVNFTFLNPLVGPVLPGEGRFPDMSDPYDPGLRATARVASRAARIPVEEGVYAGVVGPSYETPAEIRMLRALGADAVGMSTVQEVVACRAAGLPVLGISVVTNWAAGIGGSRLAHDEVVAAADAAAARLRTLITGIVSRL